LESTLIFEEDAELSGFAKPNYPVLRSKPRVLQVLKQTVIFGSWDELLDCQMIEVLSLKYCSIV
jgi:hypothetical protein